MDKITPELVWYLFLFLLPGFLMAFWVNLFVPLRPGTDNKNLITYLFMSLLVSMPLLLWFGWHGWLPYLHSFRQLLGLLLYALVVPFLAGAVLSRAVHNQEKFPWTWLEKVVGVRPVHPIASAWDKAFLREDNPWILVTTKDGNRLGARWDDRAIASSDPSERDLFLQNVYIVDSDGGWTPSKGNIGTLIKADQIAAIDFIKAEED